MNPRLARDFGKRRYARLYLIATEGAVTEPHYFHFFNSQEVRVECLRARGKSSPKDVLAIMKKGLNRMSMRAGDEAWLVVDKDKWRDEHLQLLHDWVSEKRDKVVKRGLAVSNPKFELWLLLHYADADSVNSSSSCDSELNKHLSGYKKEVPEAMFDSEKICGAIMRAKRLDTPPCLDWPRKTGTTVYRLVKSMCRDVTRTN